MATPPAAPPATTTAYLVLARKYRPQRFADLTGQEHVVRTLTNAIRSGRVAHAFLFTGPRGCGKTTSARILARALCCQGSDGQRKSPAEEPCGVCSPCLEIAGGSDVDVQEIDAASNNGVDDVRALREAARYLPARDRYKIYIVDEVHMLSAAAFNALLKTLEEPPGHIKFLLATTDPQKLPATILSRVQRHNFQLVPVGKIVARLRSIAGSERVAISDGALALAARQAQGSMRDALSLLDQLFSAHDPAAGELTEEEATQTLGALDRRIVQEAVQAVLRRDPSAAMTALVRAWEAGADFKRLAEDLAAQARNLAFTALGNVKQDLPDHELKELAQQAAGHDPAQLARVFELLQAAQEEVARAVTPRHALEIALLRAIHLSPAGGLPELVQRVERLAAQLGGAPPSAGPPGPGSPGGKGGPGPTGTPWQSRGVPGAAAPLRASEGAAGTASATATATATATAPAAATGTAPAAASAHSLPPAQALSHPHRPSPSRAPPLPPAPAPSLAPSLIEQLPIEDAWRLLLDAVRAAKKNALAATLEHTVPVAIGAAEVVIGLSRAQARAGFLTDRENRAALEAAFEKVIGCRPAVRLVEREGAPEAGAAAAGGARQSVAEQREEARSKAAAARLQQGRDHPNVQAAVALLGGELEDVRDLGEE